MRVYELSNNQLNELKNTYFWNNINNCQDTYNYDFEIPTSDIFEYYSNINFVNDDFSCTSGCYGIDYDNHDDIQKCLSCKKSKCNNCLKVKNGV